MRGRKSFLFFIVFIQIFLSSLFSKELNEQIPSLQRSDIQKIMNKFFDYHVDKKEISPLLLARSLKIYLNNFDPNHTYLLEEETKGFLNPNDDLLQIMLSEYQDGSFETYFSLNKVIQKSILRARSWRKEWMRDPILLVMIAQQQPTNSLPNFEAVSVTVTDLKQKHYEQMLALISFSLAQLNTPLEPGQENKLLTLCEKQLCQAENHYLGVDDMDQPLDSKGQEHQVVLKIVKALAHSLDAHTAYYSPEEAYAMKVQLEKGMCGIGVVLREGINGITIADIVKGGPAEKSGSLQVGDAIIEIDGQEVQDFSFHKILDVLRGDEGSDTTLGVLRISPYQGKEFHRVALRRERIIIDDKRVDVSYEPYGNGIIGKITLHSFYEGEDGISSEKDIRKALDYLKSKGPVYGLVLDMRDNTGGFLSQAIKVSGLFISSGVVVISKYGDGYTKYYRTVEGEKTYDGPLVVLISRGSASATEIVAQALQDYGVAIVVGDESTYGKGTIQHQTVTNDNTPSFFKVTIGRYYTVSGRSTQIQGVKSDILVPTALNDEKIGEGYLDYPLAPDTIAPAYVDPLTDIDPYARKWFVKFYLPTVQQKSTYWESVLPTLRKNSANRIATNEKYQNFLKKVKPEAGPDAGNHDLPMEESVNIVKDMIMISQH